VRGGSSGMRAVSVLVMGSSVGVTPMETEQENRM
jgi:hypothetical protein